MLDSNEDVEFLFDISKQIKEFYEAAVIFITRNDFSDDIFNTFCSIRTALLEENKTRLADFIVEFHLQWLRAVIEVETFMNNLTDDFSRDKVYQAISFTVDAVGHRLKYFHKYIETYRKGLSNENQANLQTDLEIIEDMHREVTLALLDKLKCFRNYDCFEEFKVKLNEAAYELLTWLDKNYDGLAIKLSKYVHVSTSKLTKTLQDVVGGLLSEQSSPATVDMLNRLKDEGKPIGSLIRSCTEHGLELTKIGSKINLLEDTIQALSYEPVGAPVLELIHKKEYLTNRVASLEKLKTTLAGIQQVTDLKLKGDMEVCICPDYYQLKVFNHILPEESREQLVTDLCYLWDVAVFGKRSHQSMISILSVADMKEEFHDEHGTFYIDEHSRKIYKSKEDNETLLQLNEAGELVPVLDDVDHIYFYDECGRYYLDPITRERIYRAHGSNSEYKIGLAGELLKVKEVKDGTEFFFDACGRFYLNEKGKRIYREEGHLSEYENDELGNIVRIRSQLDVFQPCPDDAHVTEDFKYLKQTVGPALRVCVAEVLLHQPADPIKYLSSSLVKFRENLELKDKRLREKEELDVEREIKIAEERAEAERLALEAMSPGGSEASYDTNLVLYTSVNPDAPVSVGRGSPSLIK